MDAPRNRQGRWMLVGALLALALSLVASLLSAASGSPGLALLLAALAFAGAGAITRMLSPAVLPRSPALRAALPTPVPAGPQFLLIRRRPAQAPARALGPSFPINVAGAYRPTRL